MKTIKIIIFLFSAIGIFNSCSDFLDQIPEEKLSEENLFKSKDDVVKVLTQVYSYYKNPIWFRDNPGLAADEMDCNWSDYDTQKKDMGQYSPSSLIYNHWSNYYNMIRTSQYFLNGIDLCQDEKLTENERTWWKGEANFLQAYYYFLLVSEYGPVPIIDHIYEGKELDEVLNVGLPRATMDECVNYIDSLLEKSIEQLDLFYTVSSPERAARASKCSAWFLRSRLWLYAASPLYNGMQAEDGKSFAHVMPKGPAKEELLSSKFDVAKWKKAMDYSLEAINICRSASRGLYKPGMSGVNDGYSAYWKTMNYTRGGDPCVENIFYKQNYSTSEVRQHGLPTSWGGWTGLCPTQNHVDEYFVSNGLLPEDDANYQKQTGFEVYEKNGHEIKLYKKYKNRDPRFYVNILFPGQYSYAVLGNEKEDYSTRWAYNTTQDWTDHVWYRPFNDGPDGYQSKSGRDFTSTGYLSIKFTGKTDNKTAKGDYAVSVFRYAELLLNYTEAAFEYYAATGVNPLTKEEIFTYWDENRARVQLPDVRSAYQKAGIPLTVEKLRQLIRRERAIELAFEGHRYYDNRRWLIAEREGGDKYGLDVYRNEDDPAFWNEKYVFETRYWDDKMYFMPIPQSEIDKNHLLTQNALWGVE
ncbi:MAG: RagB/SusD family nutrient uptake outer membrane protein [Massilibacteroides sp.]|nr:RagB/SusD family nutrient uptake outer membrane protein [Massilibacteroides sp.]